MTQEVVTNGRTVAGRLKVHNLQRFENDLLRLGDRDVIVTVSARTATRSLAQNRWYWSQVVGLVAEHTGYTPDDIHEIYKAKFLPKTLTLPSASGEIVGEFVIGSTTTSLNKVEFGEFCDRIRQWAAETLDVNIPDPDPDWKDAA